MTARVLGAVVTVGLPVAGFIWGYWLGWTAGERDTRERLREFQRGHDWTEKQ